MKCINFDREFERCTAKWMKEHAHEYPNVDAMEDAMPKVYAQFLDTPADWLAGKKPGEYFEQFDNPKQLVDWMEDYFKQGVPVPDMLLNRISSLGLAAEDALTRVLSKERAPAEARMCAVTLLREIESVKPMDSYISWQMNRALDDEIADNALESLQAMGEIAVPAMRERIMDANAEGREALLTLLVDYKADEQLIDMAIELMLSRRDRAAVLADCLGKMGDERALPALKQLAAEEETSYLDYIELRNAIEALGGEAPERDFDAADPDYEALRSMQ